MNEPNKVIAPIAGLVLDLFNAVRNRPYTPHSLTKLRNLLYCRKVTGADTIVEVGSYKGVMARRLSYFFNHVISVEIEPSLHAQAKMTCRKRKNIELVSGDGKEHLPIIAKRVEKAVLFLDGHYSGGETGMGDEPEPVLKELDLVLCDIQNFKAVVIDDFRLFGVENGWPAKSEILEKLEKCLPQPEWTLSILNDQFVAVRK